MMNRLRTRGVTQAGTVIAVVVLATTLVVLTTPGGAANGPQTAPTLTPSPVPAAADNFTLGNGTCDGTGGAGWRVQTFIVNAGVDVGTLAFDQGPLNDRVGNDRDNSNGSIASPLWKDGAPGTAYNPAASPAGLINPADLSAFDFSNAGWVLTDGQYQIGYACMDQLSAVRQWWSLTVTIDTTPGGGSSFMTVASAAATTTVTLSALPASPAAVGTSVTFTATVAPAAAAGSVEFFEGGVSKAMAPVSAGKATWTTSGLTAGTKSITATFTPTDPLLFKAATSTALSYTVDAATAKTTSVALTAAPATQAVKGQLVTLTATLTPSDAAGTVQFKVSGGGNLLAPVAVTGGSAKRLVIADVLGDLELAADFVPTDPATFKASTGSLKYKVVEATGAATTVTLASAPAGQAAVGAEVTFTATIAPAVPGTVSFLEGGQVLGDPVTVTGGKATYKTSSLAAGNHSIVAAFTPTDTAAYRPSSSPALALVVGGTPAISTTTTTTVGTGGTDGGTQVAGAGVGNSGGGLPVTGIGLSGLAVGLLLVYLGRVLYLLGRPSATRR